MRKLIYALHFFAVALLLFSKGTPPVKKAKLTFVVQKPQSLQVYPKQSPKQNLEQNQVIQAKNTSPKTTTPTAQQPKKKEAPPKPKVQAKKETKPVATKKPKEVAIPKPESKKALITEEKKQEELEALKKIESLLEEMKAPPLPAKSKKTDSKSKPLPKSFASISVPAIENLAAFDGEVLQRLLFEELQLPQGGEVELELEIQNGSLAVVKTIRNQNDENLAYLLKNIPQIELGNCKKIAGLENGLRLRITFCTKPL